jgi:hypothetical protein
MTEVIFGLIILASLGFNAWLVYLHKEQESKYIKALLSKDVREFTEAEVTKKPKKEETPDEFINLQDLSDQQWEKAVLKEKDVKK